METYQDYLAHHGIEGMKWGRRNGPPYPLTGGQMSAVEKKKNTVSKFAQQEHEARLNARHRVKMAKIKAAEQRAKDKIAAKQEKKEQKDYEKEALRQTKADEREQSRQNRVDEKEISRINEAEMREARRQYKQGRTYVRNAIIGVGVMTLTAIAVKKAIDKRKAGNSSSSEGAKLGVKEALSSLKKSNSGTSAVKSSEESALSKWAHWENKGAEYTGRVIKGSTENGRKISGEIIRNGMKVLKATKKGG